PGPVGAGERPWYRDPSARGRSEPFQRRAQEVEAALPRWGQALYALLRASPSTAELLNAWRATHAAHDRSQWRLSVLVEEGAIEGADETAQRQARQAATQWLAPPWGLLHDGDGYLFQGAPGVRGRRQFPRPPAPS